MLRAKNGGSYMKLIPLEVFSPKKSLIVSKVTIVYHLQSNPLIKYLHPTFV